MKTLAAALGALAILSTLVTPRASARAELPLQLIKLPPGFKISVFADSVPGARSMTRSPNGTIYVGTRDEGIDGRLKNPPAPVAINKSFPKDLHHGWKYLAFGPDGWLYVPVGAPCNVCERSDERYASILRMKPDGSHLEVYARGIRNTVGFDWDPKTHELWFTDNGRDELGDNQPADELNRAPKSGMNFGFPYCHQGDLPDPDYGSKFPCSKFTPPEAKLGPHVASLGMKFYTGGSFPAEYKDRVFIAEHGSWNRSVPIGYRVTTVDPKTKKYAVFAEGWLQNGVAWGRPVDVLVLPEGDLLVSDDKAGAIYRISRLRPAQP